MITVHPISGKILRLQRIRFRSGFSFAEVMFSIVILGIGFIMVAAIFPVALQQTRSNADQSKASQLARDVMRTIASVTNVEDYATEPTVQSFSSAAYPSQLYNKVAGSLLDGADPRYAAIPFYSSTDVEGTFRVTVVVVECANRSTYTAADLNSATGSLLPRNVTIDSVTSAADGTMSVAIYKDQAGRYAAVGPGAFLVIKQGTFAILGKPLHMGQEISETGTDVIYTLAPDTQIDVGDQFTDQTPAAVIGRDYANPNDPASGFTGPVQDVAAYTTFIKPN